MFKEVTVGIFGLISLFGKKRFKQSYRLIHVIHEGIFKIFSLSVLPKLVTYNRREILNNVSKKFNLKVEYLKTVT